MGVSRKDDRSSVGFAWASVAACLCCFSGLSAQTVSCVLVRSEVGRGLVWRKLDRPGY